MCTEHTHAHLYVLTLSEPFLCKCVKWVIWIDPVTFTSSLAGSFKQLTGVLAFVCLCF